VSITNNQTEKQIYLDWFPTASIKYQAGEVLSFYTNYKRSIERPNYKDLNPFTFFLNDNTLVVGNSNLKQTNKEHFVIGSTVTRFLSFEAYYINKNDNMLELPLQDNLTLQMILSPINIDKAIEYGFDFI